MATSEFARIARLSALFTAKAPGVTIGIGDDCAVLEAPSGERLVWTIDEQVEGTHFRLDLVGFRDLGYRSFMAAASDLAAMGAAPWCALAAVALPQGLEDEALFALAEGQREAAEAVRAPIVGGNLARAERVSIATTLLGRAAKPVLRSGARPGDGVWLAGEVGRAAAGLRALALGAPRTDEIDLCIAAWRRPSARVADGLAMRAAARAAIDVSDGLAQDAAHVAEASGVALVLDAPALAADATLEAAARALGADPLDLALHGGEDYALVVASDRPIPGFRRIGDVREGEGIVLRTAEGEERIAARGFDHFAGGGG